MLTITANLVDLTDTENVGWAVFTLSGLGSSVPAVLGSPPAILSSVVYTALANAEGQISQAIIGNDMIAPAGTFYVINIFSASGSLISTGKYFLTGSGTVDLSTQTQIFA